MIKKDIVLQVRITQELKKKLESLSEEKHISISDYIRYLIIKEIEQKNSP